VTLVKYLPFIDCHFLNDGRDPVGIWTIGWGTIQYPNGTRVRQGDVISQAQADYCLEYEVDEKARSVDNSIGTGVTVNTNQFDACVSFAYNVGTQAFADSTLLRKVSEFPRQSIIMG
jgi:lysozyme